MRLGSLAARYCRRSISFAANVEPSTDSKDRRDGKRTRKVWGGSGADKVSDKAQKATRQWIEESQCNEQ